MIIFTLCYSRFLGFPYNISYIYKLYIYSGIPSRLYLIPSANPDVVRYVFPQKKGGRRRGAGG